MDQNNILPGSNGGPEVTAFGAKNERKSAKKASVDWKSYLLYSCAGLVLVGAAGIIIYTKVARHSANTVVQNDFSVESSQSADIATGANSDPLSPESFALGQQSQPATSVDENQVVSSISAPVQAEASASTDTATEAGNMMTVEQGGDKYYIPRTKSPVGDINGNGSAGVSPDLIQKLSDIDNRLASVPSKTDVEALTAEINNIKAAIAEIKSSAQPTKPTAKATQSRRTNTGGQKKASVARSTGAPVPKSSTAQKRSVAPTNRTTAPTLKLRAVVQDQAWLENASGETISVSVSNPFIPGYGKVVRFDGENFKICFDSGQCMH